MANNNHEPEEVKVCPFLNMQPCIKEKCALWTEVSRKALGAVAVMGICGFNALHMILSEINAKTVPPPPKAIQLDPRLLKG